jgi:hypothetical protein
MTPACPPHYTCTFSPKNPPHYWAHWYDGPWGIVVALAAVAALTAVLVTVAYYVREHRAQVLRIREGERQRQHALAVEEQRTMQLDAAKGSPEMLKLVRQ